jgi:hypothetical protein
MNFNKKSTTVRGVPPVQFKTAAAQLKTGISAQSTKRPVAPPVYRPKTTAPNAAQPKMADGVVNRKLPVAPPVFRPQVPRVLQAKALGVTAHRAPGTGKIANSIRPITAKTTASRFSAVQLADDGKKAAHQCDAAVVDNDGNKFAGSYSNDIHAEIWALENYLLKGGDLAKIARIDLSAKPCKYCHIILSDLGIRGKVVTADDRKYGRCSGGSYGWLPLTGAVWNAIKSKTGADDLRTYYDSVAKRRLALK